MLQPMQSNRSKKTYEDGKSGTAVDKFEQTENLPSTRAKYNTANHASRHSILS